MQHTCNALGYVMGSVCVCLVVLMTRIEFEHVSETALAVKPMIAARINLRGKSSYFGSISSM